MAEEKIKENLAEINEADLNKSAESFGTDINSPGVENNTKQELYKKEEQKIEQAIERTGEKLKQGVPTAPTDDDKGEEVQVQAKEIAKLDANDQVGHLVQIAETKNPYLALRIAKHLNDNYVLDELHSDLTEDKMRELFISKGLL